MIASQPSDPESQILIRAIFFAARLFGHAYHHLKVRSPCCVPRRGPAILISNHTSALDPVLIQVGCPNRHITWMMAREYYENPLLKWGLDILQVIPVDRSGRDLAATRAALRVLKAGHVLGVFPEGKIEIDRNLLPFQQGVAMLAHRSDAPVFPVFLDGTQRCKEVAHAVIEQQDASIAFGAAIDLWPEKTGKPDFGAATDKLEAAVRSLMPPGTI